MQGGDKLLSFRTFVSISVEFAVFREDTTEVLQLAHSLKLSSVGAAVETATSSVDL